MKESEFIASDNLTFHVKEGKSSSNIEGAKEIKIEQGKKIPELFIPNLIRYNREHLANLPLKDSIPQLTKEQQKKYGITIEILTPKVPKTEKEVIDKLIPKYNLVNLTSRLARYIKKHKSKGRDKFKEWAEQTFGEDKIDRRKSCDNIIVQILNWQDEGKL